MVGERLGRNAWGLEFEVLAVEAGILELQQLQTLQKIRARPDEVEVVSQVMQAPKPPRLYLTQEEMVQLRFIWPEVEQLEADDRLTGDHVLLGDWLIRRDLGALQIRSFSLMGPAFTQAAVAAVAENDKVNPDAMACVADYAKRVEQILEVSGLVAFPIWSQGGGAGLEHWTLLVVKQVAAGRLLRYYDSLRDESPFNRSVAEQVCSLLGASSGCPPRCNSNRFQQNGIDCGLFSLYFWEMEVREHLGFGTGGLPWPSPGEITNRRGRVIKVVQACRQGHQVAGKINEQEGKKNQKQLQQQAGLKAAEAHGKVMQEILKQGLAAGDVRLQSGSVPWYGCPRCRWNRWGCATSADGLTIGCNPDREVGKPYKPKLPQVPPFPTAAAGSDPPAAPAGAASSADPPGASSLQPPELQMPQEVEPPTAPGVATGPTTSTAPADPATPAAAAELTDGDLKGGGGQVPC